VWCSGRCCTWARSTIRRNWLGQVDRRPRGRSGGAAPPVAVPEDRCEGCCPTRGRRLKACRAAVVPAAAVGRVLAGGEPVARTGARPVLGLAARPSRKSLPLRKQGGRVGTRCCCSWRPTGCWRRVASGACIANGSRQRHGRPAGRGCRLAEIHKLYRCHDRLLEHKQALFDHLVGASGGDLFNVSFDVLPYDLTSTYFESDPPFPEGDQASARVFA